MPNEKLAQIPYKTKWFTNGTAIQELYLYRDGLPIRRTGIYFKYQTAQVSDHDVGTSVLLSDADHLYGSGKIPR